MSKLISGAAAAIVALVSAQAFATPTITPFNPSVSGSSNVQSTSINTSGDVAGFFSVGTSYTGFMRAADGTITTFSAPGAGTTGGWGTFASSINAMGVIAGWYIDSAGLSHGFVRATDGTITSFDNKGVKHGTSASGINVHGEITGSYLGSKEIFHGFLRSPGGKMTTFDPAGSTGTFGVAINNKGVIAGYFQPPAQSTQTAFIRAADGTFTTFSVPTGAGGTYPWYINNKGAVVGTYVDSGGLQHGFLRAVDGTITTFDVPDGAGGTVARGINDAGAITGYTVLHNSVFRGFVRDPSGKIVMFSASSTGTGKNQGTIGYAINDSGTLTGTYQTNQTTGSFGFVRTH